MVNGGHRDHMHNIMYHCLCAAGRLKASEEEAHNTVWTLIFEGLNFRGLKTFMFFMLLFLWMLASHNIVLHYVSLLKIPFKELCKKA